jgi:putative membrane protein
LGSTEHDPTFARLAGEVFSMLALSCPTRVPVLLASAFLLVACSSAPTAGSYPQDSGSLVVFPDAGFDVGTADPGADAGAMPLAKLDDRQILGLLQSVNMIEIAGATNAESRATLTSVRLFAVDILRRYNEANERLIATANEIGEAPQKSSLQTEWVDRSIATALRLARVSDAIFDEAYVNDQVIFNENVLSMIDTTLAPEVRNPKLRDQVTAARALATTQLAEAKALEASLMKTEADKSAGTRPPPRLP